MRSQHTKIIPLAAIVSHLFNISNLNYFSTYCNLFVDFILKRLIIDSKLQLNKTKFLIKRGGGTGPTMPSNQSIHDPVLIPAD